MTHPNKSKMAAAAIFNLGKISITPDWRKIYAPNFMGRCITAMQRWHVTKSGNRKLIRVTSSNEGLKHMCVDLSDYSRYLNQIWYSTQIPYYQHAGMAKLKIQDDGGRHLEFRKKMSITLDWIKISTPNFMGRCITSTRRWPRDQKSKPGANSRDVIKWRSEA